MRHDIPPSLPPSLPPSPSFIQGLDQRCLLLGHHAPLELEGRGEVTIPLAELPVQDGEPLDELGAARGFAVGRLRGREAGREGGREGGRKGGGERGREKDGWVGQSSSLPLTQEAANIERKRREGGRAGGREGWKGRREGDGACLP